MQSVSATSTSVSRRGLARYDNSLVQRKKFFPSSLELLPRRDHNLQNVWSPRGVGSMKRAAVIAVIAILGVALLVRRHVLSAPALTVILLLAAAGLVYFLVIRPNLKLPLS